MGRLRSAVQRNRRSWAVPSSASGRCGASRPALHLGAEVRAFCPPLSTTDRRDMSGTGRKLSDDIYLLGDLLGKVIRSQAGEEAFALEERNRALGKYFRP